jgi:hypothetical protein
MSAIRRAQELLEGCGKEDAVLPATLLYNEGWLLRLVLDWYSRRRPENTLVPFAPNARWYSEALLPSRFLRSKKREGYTHADAVVGHFEIRPSRGDVILAKAATQLLVIEAKLGSPLSSGTRHAPTFNQAARNVACMLNMLESAGYQAGSLRDLGFLVFAPRQRLDDFKKALEPDAIEAAIRERDLDAQGHEEWCAGLVAPEVRRMRLQPVAWEDLIDEIASFDPDYGRDLRMFYVRCCRYNGLDAPVAA